MKKILSILILCALVLTVIPFSAAAGTVNATYDWYTTPESDGSYLIDSPSDMLAFNNILTGSDGQTKSEFSGATVKLGADIDMTGVSWSGTGSFSGAYFDGQGHTISNMTMSGYGMFQNAKGTLKNFSLVNATLNASGNEAGALVGKRGGSLSIHNVVSDCDIYATGYTHVGGLVGNTGVGTSHSLIISDCIVGGSITAGQYTGGMVGYVTNTKQVTVSDSTVTATINATSAVGGIIGENRIASYVTNCVFDGSITATSKYTGGIIGVLGRSDGNSNTAYVEINSCDVRGSISCSDNGTGGIIGFAYNAGGTSADGELSSIDSCLVSATLTGNGNHKGGIVGRIGNCALTASNCSFVGKIDSTAQYTGGVVAWLNGLTEGTEFSCMIVAPDVESNLTAVIGGYRNGGTKTVAYKDIYYNSDLGDALVSTTYLADGSTYYGKTAEELKSVTFDANWSSRTDNYPIPTGIANNSASVVGYQLKNNTDGSYSVRMVLSFRNTGIEPKTVGSFVTVDDASANINNEKVIVEKAYTSLVGGGKTYSASQYGADYLYFITLNGISSDVTTFNVTLTPFISFGGTDTFSPDALTMKIDSAANSSAQSYAYLTALSFNVANPTGDMADAVSTEILSYSPDVIGLQEDESDNLSLSGYTRYSGSYAYGKEYCAIYYNSELDCVEQGNKWLTSSGTVLTVALTYEEITDGDGIYDMTEEELTELGVNSLSDMMNTSGANLNPRRMTWVVLEIEGQYVIFVNTHLQNRSQNGATDAQLKLRTYERMAQFDMVTDQINTLLAKEEYKDAHVIITGDFNDTPAGEYDGLDGAAMYEKVTADYLDTSEVADVKYGDEGTWNNYYSNPSASGYGYTVLDYIFVSDSGLNVHSFTSGVGYVETDGVKTYTSDHRPVIAQLSFKY